MTAASSAVHRYPTILARRTSRTAPASSSGPSASLSAQGLAAQGAVPPCCTAAAQAMSGTTASALQTKHARSVSARKSASCYIAGAQAMCGSTAASVN